MLDVETDTGKGTTFHVVIPIGEPVEKPESDALPTHEPRPSAEP
jgi:hypothetical protein